MWIYKIHSYENENKIKLIPIPPPNAGFCESLVWQI